MLLLAMAMSIFTRTSWYAIMDPVTGMSGMPGMSMHATTLAQAFHEQQLSAAILWICGDFWAIPSLVVIVRRVTLRDGSLFQALYFDKREASRTYTLDREHSRFNSRRRCIHTDAATFEWCVPSELSVSLGNLIREGTRMDMTLSKRGDYVMRAAIFLARSPSDKYLKVREVVAGTEVPAAFASQILSDLVRAGLATSRAGRAWAAIS